MSEFSLHTGIPGLGIGLGLASLNILIKAILQSLHAHQWL